MAKCFQASGSSVTRNVRIKSKFGTVVMKQRNTIMANLSIVLFVLLVLGVCAKNVNSNDFISYDL